MQSPESLEAVAVSTASPPRGRRRLRIAALALRWHRRIGLCAALFVVFLALTGLLLMNSDGLGLPHAQVSNRWLLDWYGIRPPPPPAGVTVAGHWVTQFGSRIYLDTHELDGVTGTLLGAFADDERADELQVYTEQALVLVSPDGEVLERIGTEAGLPADLSAAGQDAQGRVVLRASAGDYTYDSTLGEFTAFADTASVHWPSPQTPPASIVDALTRTWRGEGLPLERVILDLHSGRLFGRVGVLAINLASVGLVVLACTGLMVWLRRRR